MPLSSLATPCLILDHGKHAANIARAQATANRLGVNLRPHLKTMKSAKAAHGLITAGAKGITVSTLKEVAYFLLNGITDITYAVGIVPAKLNEAASLMDKGCDLKIICDNIDVAKAIAESANKTDSAYRVLIEVDCGDQRGGVQPNSTDLIDIAKIIDASTAILQGVITHAGHSYGAKTVEAIEKISNEERIAVTTAAERVRTAGIKVDTVSMGSTPTALFAKDVTGITELRAGIYTLFDIDQHSRGICEMTDIAVSVLASVISHNRAAGKILIDAGGLALSKDRGAEKDHPHAGHGQVCDADGIAIDGLNVQSASQEHGHIKVRSDADFDAYPLGSHLRIMPIHACMMSAAYPHYNVIKDGKLDGIWERVNGW